ncbi:MAG: hypothetical protein KGI03_00955 [Patescibacteria group bacterium]|nr:hypothetical protein [Patescibacteria group bacterium]
MEVSLTEMGLMVVREAVVPLDSLPVPVLLVKVITEVHLPVQALAVVAEQERSVQTHQETPEETAVMGLLLQSLVLRRPMLLAVAVMEQLVEEPVAVAVSEEMGQLVAEIRQMLLVSEAEEVVVTTAHSEGREAVVSS